MCLWKVTLRLFRATLILAAAVLAAASPRPPARKSITAGTIIIVAQASNYIVFAADSRVGDSNGTAVASVDDTYCKIAPLPGNTLFAAAGIVTDPARSWAADTEMDRVLIENRQNTRMRGAEGASALSRWAELMMQRLITLPRNQLLAYTTSNDGVAATAVLAGIDPDGNTWVHVSKITLDAGRGLAHQESGVPWSGSTTKYFGLGQSEIAVEFDHGDTSRAVAERAHWKDLNLSGREFDRFKTRRLVELTIQYIHNKSDVGGPVDEIELDSSGQHWVQVKPVCSPM